MLVYTQNSSLLHSCGLQGQARENKGHTKPPELPPIEANTIAPCFLRHRDLQKDRLSRHVRTTHIVIVATVPRVVTESLIRGRLQVCQPSTT